MNATEIYNSFLLRRAVHLDARLAPVSTVLDLPDPNSLNNFLYEGATVFVKAEQADYQLRVNIANPATLAWYKTTKGELVLGTINLDFTSVVLDFNQVQPSLDRCYGVRINIIGANTAKLARIVNFPVDRDILIFPNNGQSLEIEHADYDIAGADRIILEHGLNTLLINRPQCPDYLVLRKHTNLLVQVSARQVLKAEELVTLKLPIPKDGEPGPQGVQGVPGPAGNPGANGLGYQATANFSTDVLQTSATEVLGINIGPNKAYTVGARVRVASANFPDTLYFEGIVSAYNVTTGILDVTAINLKSGNTSASGNWNVNLAGEFGTRTLYDSGWKTINFHNGTFGVAPITTGWIRPRVRVVGRTLFINGTFLIPLAQNGSTTILRTNATDYRTTFRADTAVYTGNDGGFFINSQGSLTSRTSLLPAHLTPGSAADLSLGTNIIATRQSRDLDNNANITLNFTTVFPQIWLTSDGKLLLIVQRDLDDSVGGLLQTSLLYPLLITRATAGEYVPVYGDYRHSFTGTGPGVDNRVVTAHPTAKYPATLTGREDNAGGFFFLINISYALRDDVTDAQIKAAFDSI